MTASLRHFPVQSECFGLRMRPSPENKQLTVSNPDSIIVAAPFEDTTLTRRNSSEQLSNRHVATSPTNQPNLPVRRIPVAASDLPKVDLSLQTRFELRRQRPAYSGRTVDIERDEGEEKPTSTCQPSEGGLPKGKRIRCLAGWLRLT